MKAFKKHEATNGLHAECLKLQQEFFLRYEGKVAPINSLIDSVRREKRKTAKSVLPSIFDTVILCGHLGIPLRGHRDNRQLLPEAGEYSKISGMKLC